MPILYSYVLSVAYPDGEDGTGGGQAPSKSQFPSQPLFAKGVPDTPIVLLLFASYAASLCALPFAIPQVPLTIILYVFVGSVAGNTCDQPLVIALT